MKLLTTLIQQQFPNLASFEVKNVVMDSRNIEEGSLFLAIQSGNQYVDEALQKGASLVIADAYEGQHTRVVNVPNTIAFMQDLAQKYREALSLQIVAITGSNGKTTTKDIVYSILSKKYRTKKTLGNYNNHIGLPFTILNLEEEDEFAILEMGMSSFGEIDLLGKIAAPNYGMITNIGDSHLEFLKTRENVFKAKTELLNHVSLEKVIASGDDVFLQKLPVFHVGYQENNDLQIQEYQKLGKKTSFVLQGKKYEIPLEGKHNVMNAAMAIALAKKIGMQEEEIQKNLESIAMTPMRFQRILRGKTEYINDAYNASPISMMVALDSFEEISHPCKIAILGDMLELGEKEVFFHQDVLERAKQAELKEVLLYGPLMKKAFETFPEKGKLSYFENKEDIKKYLRDIPEKLVLLKGSRGMKLEEIIEGEQ